ncbi:probable G-protein coupled receptor B0563.6 [Onthophagus taurus]|uniref:probable G-protein coupled receptor B0563.6 n=1 Tax=Onthophagus taurus TaxID=166361 RepID=UPI000C208E62|nr:probable G-protein coupled receptor B0563.6 [Onthophagus taurus]XP_022899792.1 probable G-protein coupled receptor B0563.6 [Onthophagus taurus]XP_022899793.1 probable G-protein coupled receptor B0563.6 [Onthophagus taurus]
MSFLYPKEYTIAPCLNGSDECFADNCSWNNSFDDPRIEILKRYSYGIALPAIGLLGVIGNILNLVVLTRKNMRGTAYIYMRGYSAAALLAILFAVPFAWRVLVHEEFGNWDNLILAFYHTHLELFLGNGCLGVGVLMLIALTLERYVSVCHPGYARPCLGPPKRVVCLISMATFIVYLPAVFRSQIVPCRIESTGETLYRRQDVNDMVNHKLFKAYTIAIELIFKVIPIILLAVLNARILLVYRKSCEKRRKMTLYRTTSGEEDPRKFAEERRLVLLLGSTSILFLVCISPMVILNVTLSENNLQSYAYQVFRALANLLEITNYSITFYIYCLFSEDFRNTLFRTFSCSDEAPNRRTAKLSHPTNTPTTTITHVRNA